MLSEKIVQKVSIQIERQYKLLDRNLELFNSSQMSDESFILSIEDHLDKLKEIAAESRVIAQSAINANLENQGK